MEQVLTIKEVLGGSRVLGRQAEGSVGLVEVIRAGVPFRAFESARQVVGLSGEEAGALLGIPRRTLARRRKEGRLTVEESDRLFRLAHVVSRAAEVFGEREKAARWLRKPNRALGDVTPLSQLDTDAGTRQVEAVLGRLEHGVFS